MVQLPGQPRTKEWVASLTLGRPSSQRACVALGGERVLWEVALMLTDPHPHPSCVHRATLPQPGAPTTTWPAYSTSRWMKFRA